MTAADKENALLAELHQEGITVIEAELPDGMWGAYNKAAGIVWLHEGMPAMWRVATLCHELEHVKARHDGHQPQAVEDRIDELVAVSLVRPEEYAFWESELGWSTGGIASALELPRWVVEAYRRRLARL